MVRNMKVNVMLVAAIILFSSFGWAEDNTAEQNQTMLDIRFITAKYSQQTNLDVSVQQVPSARRAG